MTLKQFFVSLFIFSMFNLAAQSLANSHDSRFDATLDMASLDLDYSQISDRSSSDFYAFDAATSNVLNADPQNILAVDLQNQAELERSLNMMLMRKHPMEKTGRILTYIGLPLAIIGGVMVASADELYYECVNGNCSGDARGGFGVVMLGAGTGLSITGAVLWIVGSKK